MCDHFTYCRSMDVVGLSSFRLKLWRFHRGSVCSIPQGGLLFARNTELPCSGLRARRILGSNPPALGRYVQSSSTRRKGCPGTERRNGSSGGFFRDSCLGSLTSDLAPLTLDEDTADDDYEVFDVVILSNGPGEVATWVKPVVQSLRTHFKRMEMSPRISVVLAPCPHASGAELELVRSYEQVDRCQGPGWFWNLLLFGFTEDGWKWHSKGVCIFLGGDQLYALLLGLRLGYKTIIYAEDAVRWPGLADSYMLRSEELMNKVPVWAQSSCKVVGDLFSDAVSVSQVSLELRSGVPVLQQTPFVYSEQERLSKEDAIPVVGLLPGSKGSKLALGVPYFMAVAAYLSEHMKGRVRFVLPLAPTATLGMLASHADADSNRYIAQLEWGSGSVILGSNTYTDQEPHEVKARLGVQQGPMAHLVTSSGVQIEIWQQFPAYDVFRLCSLCLTTVGTNTAELGLLGIPMLVVLPTHALEMFKGATGGPLGLLASAPGWLGNSVAQAVNLAVLKSAGYIAWPNRWAGEEVVPELVGRIEPAEVSAIAAHYLKCGEKLMKVQQRLLEIRQLPMKFRSPEGVGCGSIHGAGEAIAAEVDSLLTS